MMHTFHLAELPAAVTARALLRAPSDTTTPGLDHAECLALMRLGAPTVSPNRRLGPGRTRGRGDRSADAPARGAPVPAVGRPGHAPREAPADRRHADAMVERRHRDFHHEFATFRFRPLAEHGSWEGRTGIVPTR